MNIRDKVIQEANNYFDRNKSAYSGDDKASKGTYLARDFMLKYLSTFPGTINTLLEIGCNYGYNLDFLSKELHLDCYGIEPSDKAINCGRRMYAGGVHLTQGLSNKLPYDNESFDVVMIGFTMYITPRDMIPDTIHEVNRVLRPGGFLILTDFDTPIKFKRVNEHNEGMYVFKENYAELFLSMGYTLVEKHSYSHSGDCFNPDVQERVSTQIIYKELCEDMYVQA